MIYIEGNIGAGKSTLLRKLADALNKRVAPEPVDQWTHMTDADGKNILELFYADPKKYAYLFQSIAFRSRMRLVMDKNPYYFMERSIHTDRKVFAETCREAGFLTDIEYDDYSRWYDFVIEHMGSRIKERGYIYLCTSPKTCMDRIKSRKREGEGSISAEYLQQLHDKHTAWMNEADNVLWLDGNQDFVNDPDVFQSFITQIEEFFKGSKTDDDLIGWRGC